MIHFNANTVVVDSSNENYILVGFADEQDGECRDALHFQRAYEFDEQDQALDMASVYIERNDQSQGGYDGVERVELLSNHIRVAIRVSVAERMGDCEFEIDFSLPPDKFEQLRDGLRRVFTGFDLLTEHFG